MGYEGYKAHPGWVGGPPPPDSPYRCARVLKNGVQCKKWAISGRKWCRTHGGSKTKNYVRTDNLPKFYRNVLTTTLAQAVDEATGMSSAEALSLHEELALVRHAAGQAVALYSCAHGAMERETDQAKRDKLASTVSACAALMVDALKRVEYFCTAMARIEAMSKDQVNIHTLNGVVRQMVRIMHDVCGMEHIHIAKRFEALVQSEVVLPSRNMTGTSLTPDADVLGMDDTIPTSPN